MEFDCKREEINLRRLLEVTEQIASKNVEAIAREATAASTFYQRTGNRSLAYKSPYIVTLFKKYIEEIARMIYGLVIAREQWDARQEAAREASSTSTGSSQPPPSSSSATGAEIGAYGFKKSRSPLEPPATENLEEYRRKLSFLANLLNSPRWELPEHEASMITVVKNQHIPFAQQQAELETIAKVKTEVSNVLRSEFDLPPLGDPSTRQKPPHPAKVAGRSDKTLSHSSESGDWSEMSDGTSPTKLRLRGHTSPRMEPKGVESVFLEEADDSDENQMGFVGSDFASTSDGAQSPYSSLSPRSSTSTTAESTSFGTDRQQQPVARQLFGSSSSGSRFSSSAGSSYTTELGRKLSRGGESESGDLGRLLNADMKLQDELTGDLVKYAAAIKESALNTGLKIRNDTKQLDKMAEKMDNNMGAAKAASSTVNELLNTSSSSIWGNLTMMSMVFVAFLVVYIFMKIVPKPS